MATSNPQIVDWTWNSRKKQTKDAHMKYAAEVLASVGLKIGEGNLPPTKYIRRGYYKAQDEDQLLFAITKHGDEECKCVLKFPVTNSEENGGALRIIEDGRKVTGDKKGRGFWPARELDTNILVAGIGVRDMLSVKQATGMDVVASCGVSGLRGLEIPDSVSILYICVTSDLSEDGDTYACQRAALALAKCFENSAEDRTAYLVTVNDSCLTDAPEKANFNGLLQADPTGESIRKRFEKPIRLDDVEWAIPEKKVDEAETDTRSLGVNILLLNASHAAVMLGGSFAVISEKYNPVEKIIEVDYWQGGAFKNYYANKICKVVDEEGHTTLVPVANAWMKSKLRRTYRGVVFDPGCKYDTKDYYNLFQGFNLVKPKGGDWSLLRDHILNIMCDGQDRQFDYVMRWFQEAYCNPGGTRPGVALVLKGGQGCGKGTIMDWFSELFKPHYVHLTDGKALVGRFNKVMQGKILAFADEALFAGDKSAADKLKGMITEATIMLEPKNIDAVAVDNYMNLVIASNHEHVVNMALDERRYAVFPFSDEHKKNYEYFAAIQDQRSDGGLEALCHDLIHFKGSEINLRNPPTTDGFNEQKTLSLESVPAFWRHVLDRGYILTPPRGDWQDDPTTSTIKADNQPAPGNDQMFTYNHTPVNSDNAPCTVPYEWEEDVKIRQPFIYDEYIRYCKSINERFPKKSQSFWNTTRREGKGTSPIFRVDVDFRSTRSTRLRFFIAKGLGQMRTAFMKNVCAGEWEGGGEGDEEAVPF